MFKRFISILAILLLIGLAASFGRQIAKFRSAGRILEDKKKEVSILDQENAKLKEELKRVQTSEYMEEVAREKLGMAKEREKIVLMPQFDENPAETESQPDTGKEEVSNLIRWWKIFVY